MTDFSHSGNFKCLVRDGRGDCKKKMRVFASCRDVLGGLACKADKLRDGKNASSGPDSFFRNAGVK